MNNCPKCGNPLQVGITSCPICGTNVASNQGTTPSPMKEETSTTPGANVTPASTPVQNSPQNQNMAQVTPTPQPTNSVSQSPTNKVVASVATPPGQNISVAPKTENRVSIEPTAVQRNVENVAPNPTVAPVQNIPSAQNASGINVASVGTPVSNIQVTPTNSLPPTGITPTAEGMPSTPGIPTSLNPYNVMTPEIQNLEASSSNTKVEKPKKSMNKKTIVAVFAVLLILIIAAGLYMTMGKSFGKKEKANTENKTEIATTSVVSNGFKFELQDGWLLSEDGNNVIITNATESVALRLSESATNITDITEETIKAQIASNDSFKDTEVESTQIGARDSYVVNTKLNETLPVQIYFIGGNSTLTLGVTVIYQSNEAKDKFEPSIVDLIGTISYSDESKKAISTIGMYSDAFNLYNNIVTNKPLPVDPNNSENQENQETPPVSENSGNDNNQNGGGQTVENQNVANSPASTTPPSGNVVGDNTTEPNV